MTTPSIKEPQVLTIELYRSLGGGGKDTKKRKFSGGDAQRNAKKEKKTETKIVAPSVKDGLPERLCLTKYVLEGAELKHCHDIGKARNDTNRLNKKRNMNYSARDDELISIQGMYGEWALRKMFALPCEDLFDTSCRNTSNDTFDAVLKNGWTFDVKTVKFYVRDLLVSSWKKKNPPTFYALLYCDIQEAEEDSEEDEERDEKETQHDKTVIEVNLGKKEATSLPQSVTVSIVGFVASADLLVEHKLIRKENGSFYAENRQNLRSWKQILTGVFGDKIAEAESEATEKALAASKTGTGTKSAFNFGGAVNGGASKEKKNDASSAATGTGIKSAFNFGGPSAKTKNTFVFS